MGSPIDVSRLAARAFHRRAVLLDAKARDVASALDHHGYVQIDPINICGRMHDLMLRNRVEGYREGDLHRHLYGGAARPGFEHYLPGAGILVAFPMSAWTFLPEATREWRLRRGMYERKLPARHEKVARFILAEIAERGPLMSDEIEHDGRSISGWGMSGRLVKHLLEVLFVQGRVLITTRRNFRRVYDLPERALPKAVLGSAPAPREDARRWLAGIRLRQRRLVSLSRAQLPLVEDLVQPVRIEGGPLLYCLRSDLGLFEASAASPPDHEPMLLAPLDPLVYDRKVTRSLWDFNYTWEVYLPAHKRVRGYYALPVLAGTAIVGHIDPKADRSAGRLRVVKRSLRRGYRAAAAVKHLAAFLGLAP
jgi:uncharacterized protein YcaQ